MIGVMWVQWENESDKKVFCGAMVIGLCLAILCACTLIRKLHVVGGQARMAAPSVTLEGTEGLAWEDGIYGAGDKPQAFRKGKEGAEDLDLRKGREEEPFSTYGNLFLALADCIREGDYGMLYRGLNREQLGKWGGMKFPERAALRKISRVYHGCCSICVN